MARRESMSKDWISMLCLAGLTLLFFGAFFNRFAGLRSGNGEFTTGVWLLEGRLPYRDYFSATPPLNTLKSALLLKLFGPLLIVSRGAGVLERVLIAEVLFVWLRRMFSRPLALVGALVTIVVSAGDRTDPVASYNHDAILWAMLSGLFASYALEEERRGRLWGWALAAGGSAGLCMMTKQTVGLGAAVAVPVAVAILMVNAGVPRRAMVWAVAFTAGCAAPIAALAFWMHRLGMWRVFLTMAFLKGPAAKGGGAGAFVVREVTVARSNGFFVFLAVVAIALSVRALLRSQAEEGGAGSGVQDGWVKVGAGFGAAILAGEGLAFTDLGAVHNVSKIAVYFVFVVVTAQVLLYALLASRRRLTRRQAQFALFATVSFFVALFLSLSWPAFEAMTLPGLGMLVATVLEGVRPASRRVVYMLLGVLVFVQVREKLDLPFAFGSLSEGPVRQAVERSTLPALRGLRLPMDSKLFVEGTVGLIEANSATNDTIFTYPEMSLFYALSNRGYPTLSGSHNVDVVNDALASEEAAKIAAGRPAVVIYMPLTPEEVREEDRVWRFGRPSGQHVLVEAVERLTSTYRLAATYRVGQNQRPVMVYVRR